MPDTMTSNSDPAAPDHVTVAHGDGIGPEIMDAVLHILDEAGAPLRYETVEIGKAMYEKGHSSGIAPEAWEVIRRNPPS